MLLTAAAFIVGLNAQIHTGTLDAAGQAFTRDLGAHSIRVSYQHGNHDFGVNWAAQNNIGVVFMLGYRGSEACDVKTVAGRQCYANRSAALVSQYGDKVQYWEVWNEWNGNFGPYGDYADNRTRWAEYTDLLCRTYSAIKAVRPAARVVGGVLAGGGNGPDFTAGMLAAGAGNCMDVFSVHLYPYGAGAGNVAGQSATAGVDRFLQVLAERDAQLRAATGRVIPIIVTEAGFHMNGDQSAARQARYAEYVTLLHQRARTAPYIEGIWWFQLEDSGATAAFGLVRSDNTKKPAYDAFKTAASSTSPITLTVPILRINE